MAFFDPADTRTTVPPDAAAALQQQYARQQFASQHPGQPDWAVAQLWDQSHPNDPYYSTTNAQPLGTGGATPRSGTPPPTTTPPPSGGLPTTYTPTPGQTHTPTFNPTAPPPGTRLAPTFNPTTPLPGMPTQGAYIPPAAGTLTNTVPFGTAPPPAAKTTPTTTTTTTGDPLRDWIMAHAPANITNDPGGVDYWYNAIKNNGGLTSNMDYWVGRLNTPDTGGSSGGAGGFGAFTAPFTGTYVPPVTNFQAPVGTDDPGFQFAVQQGQDAIQRSAAAKGNLLTGGTLKDLASYTTGAALQDYSGSYNRALQTAGFNNNTALGAFGTNYDIFRNNQNDPFQKLYATTGLGLNAAGASNSALGGYGTNLTDITSQYGTNRTNLTTGQGNAQAAGTQVGSAQQNQWYQSLAEYLRSHPFTG